MVKGQVLQDFPCEYCDQDRDELRAILFLADPEEIATELRKLGYKVDPPQEEALSELDDLAEREARGEVDLPRLYPPRGEGEA